VLNKNLKDRDREDEDKDDDPAEPAES